MDISKHIFQQVKNIEKPVIGKVLLAQPNLLEPLFLRSVILLAEFSTEGSIGLILNKPMDIQLENSIIDVPTFKGDLYLGGPVHINNAFILHTLGNIIPKSVQITENIYWGGDIDIIKDMFSLDVIKKNEIKIFSGYSGWEPKQLETEIEEGSWVVSSLEDSQIMSPNTENLWHDAARNMGGKYKNWLRHPMDPELN